MFWLSGPSSSYYQSSSFHSHGTQPNLVRVTTMSGGSNQPMFHQRLPACPPAVLPTCLTDQPTDEVSETLLDFELYEMAVCLKFH